MSDLTPEIETLIVQEIEHRLAELHTGLPAKVDKVNLRPGDSTVVESVDVLPLLIRRIVPEDETEELLTENLPVIPNVPYAAGGFGGWRLHSAPHEGDLVFLAFAERSLGAWRAGDGQAVDPVLNTKHGLTDAIAIQRLDTTPLFRQIAPAACHKDDLYIGREDGSTFLTISPAGEIRVKGTNVVIDAATKVELGAGASESLVLGDALSTYLTSKLTVATAFGPSGPSSVPLVAGIELSNLVKGKA